MKYDIGQKFDYSEFFKSGYDLFPKKTLKSSKTKIFNLEMQVGK